MFEFIVRMDNPSIPGWLIHPIASCKRNEPDASSTASGEVTGGKFLVETGHECSDEMPSKG
jgi:hypothetical protein